MAEDCQCDCGSDNTTEVNYPLMRCRDCRRYFEVDGAAKSAARPRPVKKFDDDDRY